jgi:hypothetical protein
VQTHILGSWVKITPVQTITMPLFTKKPVTVEARQYEGTEESARSIIQWIESYGHKAEYSPNGEFYIHTLEGNHLASATDYIIKGVANEFYPCKLKIFRDTYFSGVRSFKSLYKVTARRLCESTYYVIANDQKEAEDAQWALSSGDGWPEPGDMEDYQEIVSVEEVDATEVDGGWYMIPDNRGNLRASVSYEEFEPLLEAL